MTAVYVSPARPERHQWRRFDFIVRNGFVMVVLDGRLIASAPVLPSAPQLPASSYPMSEGTGTAVGRCRAGWHGGAGDDRAAGRGAGEE